jgi:pimeloyl-ACP methyl ester carboxylesterase
MQTKIRDGVSLAFRDNGSSGSALVLIHGWGCDSTTLRKQEEFFSKSRRVVSVDLRGHGESSAPEQTYSVEQFADDVAWLCQELGISKATLIGHSMGGSVAIETVYRHPQLVQAVGLIDTVFQAPPELFDSLAPFLPGLQGQDYRSAYHGNMLALSLPSDGRELEFALHSLPRAPQHVLLSALHEHLEVHDFAQAAASCSVPVAYIGASLPLADLVRLKQLIPNISVGKTLGSGHFAPWIVPDQVNMMLLRFLELSVDARLEAAGLLRLESRTNGL